MNHRGGGQHGGVIFRFLGLVVFLALLAGLYTIRHPLMRTVARFWVVSDPLAHSDAILVLGDDNFAGDRAARAAELFRAGWAPRIVASGRKLRANASIAELMQHDLTQDGVPSSDVLAFPNIAQNTEEEASALEKYAAAYNWHRVIVVTSNYHTRRARLIFNKTFPSSITVLMASAPDSDFDPGSWWTMRKSEELFAHELIGYCLAMWDLRNAAGAK